MNRASAHLDTPPAKPAMCAYVSGPLNGCSVRPWFATLFFFCNPGVWRYDALTVGGQLQWQDTLNASNSPFFDAADAIFVNYAWSEGTPKQAAAAAGSRAADVFMGVDVHGRGTYGGGQVSGAEGCHFNRATPPASVSPPLPFLQVSHERDHE